MKLFISRLSNSRGMTLAEVLIAVFLTGIIALGAMQFYSSFNQQMLSQEEMVNIQQINRVCLEEIGSNLRSAGFGISGDAYDVNGDSLIIYKRGGAQVDTIQYFLEEYDDTDYANMPGLVEGTSVFWLMKQTNSDSAQQFADYLTDLRFTVISSDLVAITLETIASKRDETFNENGGFRTFTNTERVALRN